MTRNFSIDQLIASKTALERGIDNQPGLDIKNQLRFTLAGLERVHAFIGKPLQISSGYRCPELNHIVGGSMNSQHMRGEAVDFFCLVLTAKTVARILERNLQMLGIDQLIFEHTWVHVSFTLEPRCQALTLRDGSKYLNGIV